MSAEARPYERLLELAEREAGLVAAGAWDDLAPLAAERTAVVAALPAVPPAAARPALERLSGLQQLATATLVGERAKTGEELGRLGHGRGAVRGYATASAHGDAPSFRLDGAA